jgi:hypothetical protein
MTIKEINKLFTDKLMEYISDGYIVNSNTMGGTQGEIAKVDLVNYSKGDIIRLYMDRESKYPLEYLYIIAERIPLKKGFSKGFDKTIWNGKHEKIYEVRLIEIDYGKYYVFPDSEEYNEIKAKRRMRYERGYWQHSNKVYLYNSRAKIPALKLIKKNPRTKTIKIKDIECVYKMVWRDSRTKYYTVCKGKCYSFKTSY